jgi:hypothetical protein
LWGFDLGLWGHSLFDTGRAGVEGVMMDFIDIRQLMQTEKIKNPQGIAPLMQKADSPETFWEKLRRFIGDYRGVIISNHGFSTKIEYLVKITKKNLQFKVIKDTGAVTFSYDFEFKKLYRNNKDTSDEDVQKFMKYTRSKMKPGFQIATGAYSYM